MLDILPQLQYKADFPYDEERMSQVQIQQSGNDSIIFSFNDYILTMLKIDDSYSEKNQIYIYIKKIYDLIIQNYSIQITLLQKIWSDSIGNLLINFIKNNDIIDHLSISLNLINLFLKVQDSNIYFSEFQLDDIIIEILVSFSTEPHIVTQCFMVLSNLLPFLSENLKTFLPEFFSKINFYKIDSDCEFSISRFIYKIVQIIDSSSFYEAISCFFNSILIQDEFSNKTLNFILKTTQNLLIQNQKSPNKYLKATTNNIITIISNQMKNSIPKMKLKFLKFTKKFILYSEKPQIYHFLRKVTIPTFIEIYEGQENSKIATITLEIFLEILKIENDKKFFCQFDLAIHFDDDLLSLIVRGFDKKPFSEKRAVLNLLSELSSFQKVENFNVLKNKNKFIFEKLLNFAFNSKDFSDAAACIVFLMNYAEMSLLFDISIGFSPFIKNFFEFEVDKIIDSLIEQNDDKGVAEQAMELKKIVSNFPC